MTKNSDSKGASASEKKASETTALPGGNEEPQAPTPPAPTPPTPPERTMSAAKAPGSITVEYTGIANLDDMKRRPHEEYQDEILGLRWVLWSNKNPHNRDGVTLIPHETKRKRRWRDTPENRELLAGFVGLAGFKVSSG